MHRANVVVPEAFVRVVRLEVRVDVTVVRAMTT